MSSAFVVSRDPVRAVVGMLRGSVRSSLSWMLVSPAGASSFRWPPDTGS